MNAAQITRELKKIKKALIFSHTKPDGDTIGSAYGLSLVLKAAGIQSVILCDSPIPDKFAPLIDIQAFLTEYSGEFDALIAVDCSDEYRLGKLTAFYLANAGKVKTFNIDHHISNTRFAKFNYVAERSSTAELILEVSRGAGVLLNEEIARPLLLGICTDTGSFAHKNVTAQTFTAAAALVEAGADLNRINYLMFKNQSRERAGLFADTVSKIRYFENGQIALISVSLDALSKYGATPDMTEGFIDFPLSVEGVEIAMCLLQSKTMQYKVSFRSKGVADVNEIAGIFGGGGHILASGCMINGELEEVIDKLIAASKARL